METKTMLVDPLAQLLYSVLLFSAIPFLLSTLNNQSRTLYFYCYMSILFFLGGTLSTIYSIKVTDYFVMPGGSLAFAAFMMTTVLFVMLQRELETIKNVIKLIFGINIFIYLLFSLISISVESGHNSAIDESIVNIFSQSMPIMLIGMVLICLELLSFVFIIEKVKKIIKGPIGLAMIYVIVFTLLLLIDGLVFQYLISNIFNIPPQNLENQLILKLVLAGLFSIPMVAFLLINKAKLGMYVSETLDFSDLLPISKSKLLKEIEKQRQIALMTNKDVRELAERLSIATESFNLGIWELDLASEKCIWDEKMYELYNTSFKHFNHTLAEWKSYILEEDLNDVIKAYENVPKTKHSGSICFRIKPLNQKIKWIESHFKVFFDNDKPVKLIGLNFDITEKRRLESLSTDMQLKDFGAKKSEAIKMILGGIAHDFGNILLPLGGYAQEILESENTSSTDKENVQKIIDASARAESLLKRIITLLSNHAHDRRPTKLQDIVRGVCRNFSTIQTENIQWHLQLEEDCPTVLAPPIHLKEIVNQLCKNAVYAMRHDGGKLSISVSLCKSNTDASDEKKKDNVYFVELIVADEGEGIERGSLEKIFDPYFTTRAKKDGTGLGLAIVKSLVLALFGQIEVCSEKGKGSRIYVKLPAYTLGIK